MSDNDGSNEIQAAKEWTLALQSLPKSHISKDGKEILTAAEKFIIQMNEVSQADETRMEVDAVKNPSVEAINERLNWHGEDHKTFQDLASSMGLDRGIVGDGNAFAKSSSESFSRRSLRGQRARTIQMKQRLHRRRTNRSPNLLRSLPTLKLAARNQLLMQRWQSHQLSVVRIWQFLLQVLWPH